MPTRHPIDRSDTPIRLFKSDVLEFFTHVTPAVVVIVWLPVAVWLLSRAAWRSPAGSVGPIATAVLAGILAWTLTEYLVHRFVFHFEPRTPAQERILFLFHGVHHAQPQLKTRLVMPPVVSLPLAALLYGVFLATLTVLGLRQWLDATCAGAVVGYLAYDLTHYATHHLPMRRGVLKFLKQHHMKHHYQTEDRRYGVSSPLWDVVFRTMPDADAEGGRATPARAGGSPD
jgi:sterol desaturase/sphingolipid hydroxylase (fatty acid hydroxylase superfamily)